MVTKVTPFRHKKLRLEGFRIKCREEHLDIKMKMTLKSTKLSNVRIYNFNPPLNIIGVKN